jgi:hypothetical protein
MRGGEGGGGKGMHHLPPSSVARNGQDSTHTHTHTNTHTDTDTHTNIHTYKYGQAGTYHLSPYSVAKKGHDSTVKARPPWIKYAGRPWYLSVTEHDLGVTDSLLV